MLSEEQLQYYKRKADQGSQSALDVLLTYNRTQSARANARMKALEKSGYDYYAYDIAKTYVEQYGRERFSTSRKLLPTTKDLVNQLRVLNKFLSAESSTIKGQKRIEERRISEFSEKGFSIPVNIRKDFLIFLGSEETRYAFEIIGDSDKAVRGMIDLINESKDNRKKLNELKKDFENYYKGELSYNDLMKGLKME